jgi:heme/copper-type cytochrome/quinol oxidase subunit 2
MTFSILWVVLAATVTIVASMRRSGANQDQGEVRVRQSGKALTVVAVVYSLVLLAGFLYIGWQHGLALMR